MKINHDCLFVLSDSIKNENFNNQPAFIAIQALKKSLEGQGFRNHEADSIPAGYKFIQQSPRFSAILVYWDKNNKTIKKECEDLLHLIRERNDKVPIFLLSDENITDQVSLSVLQAVNEYVYLYSETPDFTAKRIYTAAYRYADNLLPPYFKTLKDFTEDGDYYWDCPGHMGGMAYLKHPVGVEFIKFFGENLMRADIGVATAEMGDYLVHAGPSKEV